MSVNFKQVKIREFEGKGVLCMDRVTEAGVEHVKEGAEGKAPPEIRAAINKLGVENVKEGTFSILLEAGAVMRCLYTNNEAEAEKFFEKQRVYLEKMEQRFTLIYRSEGVCVDILSAEEVFNMREKLKGEKGNLHREYVEAQEAGFPPDTYRVTDEVMRQIHFYATEKAALEAAYKLAENAPRAPSDFGAQVTDLNALLQMFAPGKAS